METLDDDLDEAPQKRFVHGEWEHIFEGSRSPDLVRVAFDREHNRICRCELDTRSGWQLASQSEAADVEDSWKNGNPELLDDPVGYGLNESDDLPDWAGSRTTVE